MPKKVLWFLLLSLALVLGMVWAKEGNAGATDNPGLSGGPQAFGRALLDDEPPPTDTPEPTPTDTPEPTPTDTPEPTPTDTPEPTPTDTPEPTPTDTPEPTPTDTPEPTPTDTPVPTPTDTPGPSPTPTRDPCNPDTERPTITCPEAITVTAASGACSASVEFEATATDNCDEEVPIVYYIGNQQIFSPHEFPVGTSGVFAIAEDSSGNVRYCGFEVTVLDADPPTITCPQDINAYGCSAMVSFEASASDPCGGVTVEYFIGEQAISSPYRFPLGTTTVLARATDASGNAAECTFMVTVTNTGGPVAQDDTATVFQGTPATIRVLDNDSDPDGDSLSVVSVGTPAHGTATTNGSTVTYTPDDDYIGEDSFTYTVSDGCETDEATVYVTVVQLGRDRIYGWVFLDDGDGVRGPDETTGLANVLLELWDEGVMVATTDTSAPEGAYEFVDVPAGFYHVQVQVPLDYVPTSPTRVGVEVVRGHWAQANFGVKLYETPTPTPTNTPTPTRTGTPTPTPTATSPKTDTWVFLPLIRK